MGIFHGYVSLPEGNLPERIRNANALFGMISESCRLGPSLTDSKKLQPGY